MGCFKLRAAGLIALFSAFVVAGTAVRAQQATPSQLPPRFAKELETMDETAFSMMLSAMECTRDARKKIQMESPGMGWEELDARANEACDAQGRTDQIFARLKQVHPEMDREQLLEKHKNMAILAAFYSVVSSRKEAPESTAPRQ